MCVCVRREYEEVDWKALKMAEEEEEEEEEASWHLTGRTLRHSKEVRRGEEGRGRGIGEGGGRGRGRGGVAEAAEGRRDSERM